MEKCSHEGDKMGVAGKHLRDMHREHGSTDHARAHSRPAGEGNKAVGGAKQPMRAIDAMGKMGRKDG